MFHIFAGSIQTLFPFLTVFGVACALRRNGWNAPTAMAGALAIIGALAFGTMIFEWAALPNTGLQIVLGIFAIGASFFLVAKALAQGQGSDEVARATLLALACTCILLVWTYAGAELNDPLAIAATRFTHELPGDSRLPLHFAAAFQNGHLPTGQPTRDMGDWLYSDRPPLQAALFMLTPGFIVWGADPWVYQCAAVAFQMFVLLGIWALVRTVSNRPWIALLAEVAAFFTPLVLVNGIFVWPKLLAAAFLLCLVATHLSPRQKSARLDPVRGGFAGALAALAMLSHGSSAFAIIGIALTALVLGRLGGGRYLGALAGVALLLYAPWGAYQKFVDPPGDRLLKWHLAGVVPIDDRSLLKTLEDSYRSRSWNEILETRIENFKLLGQNVSTVFTHSAEAAEDMVAGRTDEMAQVAKSVRINEFFGVVASTGLLGLFFVFGLAGLLTSDARPIVVAVVATILVWLGLLYSDNAAVPHQGSYFPELAVIAIAVVMIARWSRVAVLAAVATHCALTIFQYSI